MRSCSTFSSHFGLFNVHSSSGEKQAESLISALVCLVVLRNSAHRRLATYLAWLTFVLIFVWMNLSMWSQEAGSSQSTHLMTIMSWIVEEFLSKSCKWLQRKGKNCFRVIRFTGCQHTAEEEKSVLLTSHQKMKGLFCNIMDMQELVIKSTWRCLCSRKRILNAAFIDHQQSWRNVCCGRISEEGDLWAVFGVPSCEFTNLSCSAFLSLCI